MAVDLFSGAGGLSLGFEQAGWDVAAAVEHDPVHCAIHHLNFPETTTICADVSELSGDDIRRLADLEDVDIDAVVGGPPCQGFSLIGQRILEDKRNSLVLDFCRIVEELQPKLFVMENVPGMASGKHHQLLDELLERFESIGYRVRKPYQILNAAEYGVPQNRRRLILIGARADVDLPEYPVAHFTPAPKRKSATATLLNGSAPTPTVGEAIGDLPDIEHFDELFASDVLRYELNGGSEYAGRLRGDLSDPSDYSYPRLYDTERITGLGRARHTELSRSRFAATNQGDTEPVSRFFRLPWDGQANTLRAGTASDHGAYSAPRPIHPTSPRCITVREAARLHSFPDWFRFHRTIWHGFRQIGNAVAPKLGRAIGASLIEVLDVTPTKPDRVVALGDERLATFDMRAAADYFQVRRDVIPTRKRLVDLAKV